MPELPHGGVEPACERRAAPGPGRPGRGRLVLVVHDFPRLSEAFIVDKFLGLLAKGWDVHVACGRRHPGLMAEFPALASRGDAWSRVTGGCPLSPRWSLPMRLAGTLLACLSRNPWGALRYLRRGRRLLGWAVLQRFCLDAHLVGLKPDQIHFEFGSLACGRMYLKELLDCRITVSFRGYDLNSVGLDRPDYYREVFTKADALHLLGEGLWRQARRRGCPDSVRRALIPPAVDAAFFDPGAPGDLERAGSRDRPLRILGVGRLDWKKGYEFALFAARLLLDDGVCFEYRIVGDGDHLEAVAFLRRRLGLEDSVRLLGPLSRLDIRGEMSRADVLLHAAVSEGFCNAVLEAQAMSLPVVCTDAGGLLENVASGISALVAPRRDARALADSLRELAGNPELRRRMGSQGRRRAVESFTPARQIEAFERFFEEPA